MLIFRISAKLTSNAIHKSYKNAKICLKEIFKLFIKDKNIYSSFQIYYHFYLFYKLVKLSQ